MARQMIHIEIPVFFHEEDGVIIAHTPALHVATQGDTEKQAMENFDEAVQLFIETCIERNSLKEALLGLGWKVRGKNVSPAQRPLPTAVKHPISFPVSAVM